MKYHFGMLKQCAFIALVTFIVLILMTVKLDFSKMWCFADLLPFPKPMQKYEELSYIWVNEGLGSINTPMINTIRFEYLLMLVIPSLTVAQKVYVFLPFFVGSMSMFFLLKKLRLSFIPSSIGAVLFVFNPLVLSIFIIGGTGVIMTIVSFPLLFYSIFMFLDNRGYRYLAFFGILYYILALNIYTFVWLFIGGVILILFLKLKELSDPKYLVKTILRLGMTILLISILSAPAFLVLLNVNQNAGREIETTVTSEVVQDYQDVSILNLIRLGGSFASPQNNGYLGYDESNSYTIWGDCLFAVLILAFFLTPRSSKNKRIIESSFLLLLATMGFLFVIKLFPQLTVVFPLFYTLRNPEKLLVLLGFVLVINFASSLETLKDLIPTKRKKIAKALSSVFFICVITMISLYNMPFLDGSLAINRMQGSVFVPAPYYVEDRYYELPRILGSLDPNFQSYNFLIVPWERFQHNIISRILPNYFGIGHGSSAFGNMSDLVRAFNDTAKPQNATNVLTRFNVKFVVVDKNFKSMWPDKDITAFKDNLGLVWLIGDPKNFISLFDQSGLKLIYEDENFVIYTNPVLTAPGAVSSSSSAQLTYLRVNPTLWKLSVNSTSPFTLYLAQIFDPGWEANVYKDDRMTEREQSFASYGGANGFNISTTGENLSIEIYYQPQFWFEVGSVSSLTSFVVCLICAIFSYRANLMTYITRMRFSNANSLDKRA
jgi:hypothetical protein